MTLPALTTTEELENVLALPVAVLYKHSSRCAFSAYAHGEVTRFAAEHSAVPVALVDVVFDRALSDRIAERLAVRHESPQAIVLRFGTVVWHGSHGAVRSTALHDALK